MRKDDPFEVVHHLVTTIGVRRATSLEEAEAAAYIDGRMRRAGLFVSATAFLAPSHQGHRSLLLFLPAIAAALLTGWLPFPSFLLSVWVAFLTTVDMLFFRLPTCTPNGNTQNIVGTCEAEGTPRWRVVLLAPLDSPGNGDWQWFSNQHAVVPIGRLVATWLIPIFALGMLLVPVTLWWYAQSVPVAYLLVTLVAQLLPAGGADHGSKGGAGALAGLLAAAEQLTTLKSIELWVVALGATTTSERGIHDLLARYPFEPTETLFLALEKIGDGELAYALHEGLMRRYPADELLIQLADAVCEQQPGWAIVPRPSTTITSLAMPLHKRGYRALTLYTSNHAPYQEDRRSKTRDEERHAQVVATATQVVVAMVRHLDSQTTSSVPGTE